MFELKDLRKLEEIVGIDHKDLCFQEYVEEYLAMKDVFDEEYHFVDNAYRELFVDNELEQAILKLTEMTNEKGYEAKKHDKLLELLNNNAEMAKGKTPDKATIIASCSEVYTEAKKVQDVVTIFNGIETTSKIRPSNLRDIFLDRNGNMIDVIKNDGTIEKMAKELLEGTKQHLDHLIPLNAFKEEKYYQYLVAAAAGGDYEKALKMINSDRNLKMLDAATNLAKKGYVDLAKEKAKGTKGPNKMSDKTIKTITDEQNKFENYLKGEAALSVVKELANNILFFITERTITNIGNKLLENLRDEMFRIVYYRKEFKLSRILKDFYNKLKDEALDLFKDIHFPKLKDLLKGFVQGIKETIKNIFNFEGIQHVFKIAKCNEDRKKKVNAILNIGNLICKTTIGIICNINLILLGVLYGLLTTVVTLVKFLWYTIIDLQDRWGENYQALMDLKA